MVPNLSQTSNTIGASPAANMLSFGTPSGLGVEGLTPGMLNMPTPALGGMPMGISMSELGIPAGGGQKRNEDEERRAKMWKVLKSIGKRNGRVSEEGIARVSRRVGFANDIDAEGPEEREKKAGNRVITTAGSKTMIEVELKNHAPQNVQVTFDTANSNLEAQAGPASKVLMDDLQSPEGVSLTTKLDRYAANLERLARIDRLCINQVNCFEALSGVYTSLHRLHEQELKADREVEVMRKKSGRPTVHANGRLGTKVEYWRESAQGRSTKQDTGVMEVDGGAGTTRAEQYEDGVYKLHIGIEASPAGLYPSVRLSDTWLPDPLQLHTADVTTGLPWLDPPPTFITAGIEADAMTIDNNPKLSDLRFTAKLEPPIILPWQVASAVIQSVGLPMPQVFVAQAWHSVLLNPDSTAPFDAEKDGIALTAERSVLCMQDGEETEVTHLYTLDVLKPDMAYKLEELPFSHPRQLVEMLPTLRQWACFGSLVRNIFVNTLTGKPVVGPSTSHPYVTNDKTNGRTASSLADLLTPPTTPSPLIDTLPISIALTTSPMPTLSLSFPSTSAESTTGNVNVQILPNAELVVTSQEGITKTGEHTDGVENAQAKNMAKALDVCGDLGVWVEWLRNRA